MIDLAELVGNRAPIALPVVREREGAIIAYRLILVAVLRRIREEAERSVVPAYAAAPSLVRDEAEWFEQLRSVAAYAFVMAASQVGPLFRRESDLHAERFVRSVKKATRVVLPIPAVTNPTRHERLMRAYVEANTSLIKSLADEAVRRVEAQVLAARMSGLDRARSVTKLRRDIREGLDISKRRADLIAEDQMASLNTDLAQMRHAQTGMTHYQWQTRADSRVRDRHRPLRGNVYRWGEPTGAEGGLPPGKPIRCRCTPIPILPGQSGVVGSVSEQRAVEARNSAEQRRIARRRRAA